MRNPQTGRAVIEHVPEIRDLPVLQRMPRPIPDEVALKVMEQVPQHVREAMVATLFFGFRRGEIFGATIEQVDFNLGGFRVDAARTKNKQDAFLPGAPEAMEFMRALVEQARSRGTKYLITWRRLHKDPEALAAEPWVSIKQPRRAWARIMKLIEEQGGSRYRWHDIRAAFITNVALSSGPLAAQRLARHSSFSTTQAYIAVADPITREAATRTAQRPALQRFRKLEHFAF